MGERNGHPARIEPPDPLAPLEEWQSFRAGLDALEARLRISHGVGIQGSG